MNKSRKKIIFEGKTKILYQGPEPDILIQHFKDDVYFLDKSKRSKLSGKGILNNRISEALMLKLSEIGIPNHFIRSINMREQYIKNADMIPIKIVIRNVAAGNLSERLDISEGIVLPSPIIEFYYKNEKLNNPLINEDHIVAFNWADKFEIEEIKTYSLRINDYLSGLFNGIRIRLVDFKLEFGRHIKDHIESIILADEITPDTCRLWDLDSNEILDKNRITGIEESVAGHREIAKRLKLLEKNK